MTVHREMLRHKLSKVETVSPNADLKVIFENKTIVSTNLGDTTWRFDEIVIVETEFEGRRTLGVLMVEPVK